MFDPEKSERRDEPWIACTTIALDEGAIHRQGRVAIRR
jgi:hypothetical protein